MPFRSCMIAPALIFALTILPVRVMGESEKPLVMARVMVNPLAIVQATGESEQLPDLERLNRSRELYVNGVEDMDDEDFDAAIKNLKEAIQLDPLNLEYQYVLGVVYTRLKMNEKALAVFEALLDKDPANYFKVCFDMASIYGKEKEYQKVIDILGVAEEISPGSGRIFLEKGYAWKNLHEYDQAIKDFQKAGELDPDLNQLALYMIGATKLEEEKFDAAVDTFKMAAEIDPATPLAENARLSIPMAEYAAWARKPWYLFTTFNWGYDDNVPRDPLGVITGRPTELPTNAGDQFQTFHLRGGYKFINEKDLEMGVGYTLFSLGYRDWTDSNVTSQSPHFYVQGQYDPVLFRFQYDFSYFYAGGKKQGVNPPLYLTFANNSYARLRMHSFMPTVTIFEPYDLRTDINLSYQIKEYIDGVTGDASRYSADITQSYQIPSTNFYPRIGYRYATEKSQDDMSTYQYHELFAGISSPVYWEIWGDFSFNYMGSKYPDFSPDKSRNDDTFTFAFSLKRTFIQRLLVSFTYLYMKNNSDFDENGEDLYTFDKNMYILSASYAF